MALAHRKVIYVHMSVRVLMCRDFCFRMVMLCHLNDCGLDCVALQSFLTRSSLRVARRVASLQFVCLMSSYPVILPLECICPFLEPYSRFVHSQTMVCASRASLRLGSHNARMSSGTGVQDDCRHHSRCELKSRQTYKRIDGMGCQP